MEDLQQQILLLKEQLAVKDNIVQSEALNEVKQSSLMMTALQSCNNPLENPLAKYNIKDIPNYLTFAYDGIEGAVEKTPEFIEKYNGMSDTHKAKFFNFVLDMDNGSFQYKDMDFIKFGEENDFVLQYKEEESMMVA